MTMSIMTSVKAIDNISFRLFPTRPVKITKIVRVAESNIVVATGIEGYPVYTNVEDLTKYAFPPHVLRGNHLAVLRALIKLGKITKEDYDEFMRQREMLESQYQIRNLEDDYSRFLNRAKKLGVSLPSAASIIKETIEEVVRSAGMNPKADNEDE